MPKPAHRPSARIPEPRTISVPRGDYQPTKAELEEEVDMPGMSADQVRDAFFRPFRFIRDDNDR